MPTTNSGFMIQSTHGTRGNFELVVASPMGGLLHCWRDNDALGYPWKGPHAFGSGEVLGVSLIQSNYRTPDLGNLEVIARVGDQLAHYWREDQPPFRWFGPFYFASGVSGNPALIQSRFGNQGNFEVVVPLVSGGLAHYWRNNDNTSRPWIGPTVLGTTTGQVEAVALIQSNFGNLGNLEVTANVFSGSLHWLAHFWRDSGPALAWNGPNPIPGPTPASLPGGFEPAPLGVPGFIQSRHGTKGNFEIVISLSGGGMAHLWRNNDAPDLPWSAPTRFGNEKVTAVALIQSNFGTPGLGNLEVAARIGNRTAHYYRRDQPPFGWSGPTAFACDELHQQPQYVLVHKTYTPEAGTPNAWYQQNPKSICQGGIDEIVDAMDGVKGSVGRLLGFSYSLNYLDNDLSTQKESLKRLLDLSPKNDMPVHIAFDGLNWWGNRPDLWNWWDPDAPGYHPNNVRNVEWIGWGLEHAVKLCWRNWGCQIRVNPMPNLVSPEYIQARDSTLSQLLAILVSWYDELEDHKKHLLAGISFDNEVSFGVNYYYYENGNSYLDDDPANDPQGGTDFSKGLSGGLEQLGHNAVRTLLNKDFGTITREDLHQVVQFHIEHVSKVIHDAGIPRSKIWTHGGGNIAISQEKSLPHAYSAALSPFATPGWSFYDMANNPAQAPELRDALAWLSNTPWYAPEWLYIGTGGEAEWRTALDNTIGYKNNHGVNVYNWEGIRDNADAIRAIKNKLRETPPCLVGPPAKVSATVTGNTVRIIWSDPIRADALYLNISTQPDTLVSGTLKNVYVVNEVVTDRNSHERQFLSGTYYYMLVADGCNPVQRVVTDLRSFVVE